MVKLQSKLIESVVYDAESQDLRIHMCNGQIREFSSVPTSVFENLVRARSAGRFYMDNIRGQYLSAD
ncbi:KTSC domain-containing protein [Pararhizobium antarcticum]